MKREYVMGNGAIALGALSAGVKLCAGYPGTPSSEIIETMMKYKSSEVYIEWSVNEKAALEIAAGAAYSGARAMVTMKQVGLNVASDPLMSLSYVGVKGGLVVVAADDPGPVSSQTEQDTRIFAEFARIPIFDPSSPEEAFQMARDAFDYSEKYNTPVILRPTTRICHAYAGIEFDENAMPRVYEGFVKDPKKWVIFPRLSFINHEMIEKRNPKIGEDFSDYKFNYSEGSGKKAVFASGISWAYAKEYIKDRKDVILAKISTPYPFPEKFALSVLREADEVLCFEELSPYIEVQLQRIAGMYHLPVKIFGKTTGNGRLSGENSADNAMEIIGEFLGDKISKENYPDMPPLPARPPVLCAGCPHRASFYAVKKAMEGKKAYFCGDIGCYTLGNAAPLDMTDTCLCMGAGITIAQGFNRMDSGTVCFAFVGDSTFFASGITGTVNAVYNQSDIILCILDNSTTAMTGHQPHPGTGRNLMNDIIKKVDIAKLLEGIGVDRIITVNPFDLKESIDAVHECAGIKGVKAIIFKAPCIALEKHTDKMTVSEKCVKCGKCIKEIGCPAIVSDNGKIEIDKALCTGCGLCAEFCPVNAIGRCFNA